MNKLRFQAFCLFMSLFLIGRILPVSAQTRRPKFESPSVPLTSNPSLGELFSDQDDKNDTFGRCQQDQGQDLASNEYFRLLVSPESVGTTVEAYPTVLAYVPPTSASHLSVSVKRLRDGLNIYQSTIRIRPKSLNAVPYPDYLDPLEVGEQYLWSVSLLCESVVLLYNPVDQLILMRQSPDALPETLEDPLAVGRARSLGEMGVWHDMVSRLYFEAVDRRNSGAMQRLKELVASLDIPLGDGDRF